MTPVTPDEELSAYHEAGHAVFGVRSGATIDSISICPDRDDGPQRLADIQMQWDRARFDDRTIHERLVAVALAGPVAEMLYSGDPYHPGFVAEWADDWQLAWQAATPLFPNDRRRLAHLEQVTRELYRELDAEPLWSAVAAVADHLLAYETLEGSTAEQIIMQWLG